MAGPDTQRIYQLIIDAGGAKAGAEVFKAAAEKISDAATKAAAAGKPLVDNVAQSEKAFSRLVTKIDPVARAQLELARDLKIVERALASQSISVDEATSRIGLLGQRYERALSRASGTAMGFGSAIQQAGFQVGDFAVQMASGQGFIRPFIQQGTQLISMFGPWGAALGALGAVVGALAVAFWDVEDASKAAEDALDAYNEAVRQSEALTKALHGTQETNIANLQAERRYRIDLADAVLTEAQAKITAAKAAAAEAAAYAEQTSTSGDESTLFGGQAALAVAEQKLARIKEINAEIILQQRKLLAENKFGGEMMDPFAAMGGDFTSSYYDPTKTPKGEKDPGGDAIDDLRQRIALFGDLTNEEKALYEVSQGRYKNESAAEKEKIVSLARILDLKQALADEDKKSAEIAKKRDAAEVAEYDKIIDETSKAWDERVKRGKALADEVRTPLEIYQSKISELNVALRVGTITQETYNRQVAKAQDAFEDASEGTKVFRDAAEDAMGILQAGLIDAAFNAKNLKEALSEVTLQLAKMAANKAFGLLMDKGIDGLMGLFNGGGAGPSINGAGYRSTGAGPGASANTAVGFFGWLASLFRFEGGGVMTSAGPMPLRRYSGGGIANSPQVAMFAEGSTPEAYVPVPNGMIPVEIRGAGRAGPTIINNNIRIEGGGGTPEQNQDMATKVAEQLERRFAAFVDQRMADQQRGGGLLNQNPMSF